MQGLHDSENIEMQYLQKRGHLLTQGSLESKHLETNYLHETVFAASTSDTSKCCVYRKRKP